MITHRTFNILHTEASTGWGGQEIRTLQESFWLAGKGHRIFIACPPESGIYKRYHGQGIPNLTVCPFPFRRTLDPFDIAGIYRLIRSNKIDIVHTHSSIDSWTASVAAKLAGVPVVRSRHVTIPVKDFFPRNFVYRFPDRIITSGNSVAEMMASLKSVSPAKVLSIVTGVNTQRFHPGVDGSAVRAEFNIPLDAVLIGKVAIMRGWKGHLDFVDAAEKVSQSDPGVWFLLVGAGDFFEQVRDAVKRKKLEKHVILTGFRENIPQILNSLDVLVLASKAAEAAPQVISQAWACKRCVLATTAGGIVDLVKNEENGLLVPPSDPEAMAEAMRRLIRDPALRNRLAEAGYAYTMEYLTEEKMMEKVLGVYEELKSTIEN